MKCWLASAQHRNHFYRCSDTYTDGARNLGLTTNSSNFLRPIDNFLNEASHSISDRSITINSQETSNERKEIPLTINKINSNDLTNRNTLQFRSSSSFFKSLISKPVHDTNIQINNVTFKAANKYSHKVKDLKIRPASHENFSCENNLSKMHLSTTDNNIITTSILKIPLNQNKKDNLIFSYSLDSLSSQMSSPNEIVNSKEFAPLINNIYKKNKLTSSTTLSTNPNSENEYIEEILTPGNFLNSVDSTKLNTKIFNENLHKNMTELPSTKLLSKTNSIRKKFAKKSISLNFNCNKAFTELQSYRV